MSKLNLDTPRQQRRSVAIAAIVFDLKDYWPLTVRQIHYQALARGVTWDTRKGEDILYQNSSNQYSYLCNLLTPMRVEGVIPWEAIQDLTRRVSDKRGVEDISATIDQAMAWLDPKRYERCLIQGQETYVEVWTEKEALFGILQPVTDEYCTRLASCKGFSSSTMAYEYGKHRAQPAITSGQQPVILLLSDFDPAGMAMLGAIQWKLEQEVGVYGILYERVGLTPQQIGEYGLAYNPEGVKHGDTRGPRFIREYGPNTVELDALHPSLLQDLVRFAIEEHIDTDLVDEQQEREKEEKENLAAFARGVEQLRQQYNI